MRLAGSIYKFLAEVYHLQPTFLQGVDRMKTKTTLTAWKEFVSS